MKSRKRNYVKFMFVGTILLLTGCVSYSPPPTAIHSKQYSSITVKEHKILPPSDKVLTRDMAVKIALENNPDYESARLSMVAAYAAYYAALSAYSPILSLNYTATQVQHGGTNRGFGESAALTASYQAFSGLTTTMTVLSSLASAKASEYGLKNARRLLVLNTILIYNKILLDRANLEIQRANERFNAQMVENAELKYKAGATSLSDLLNWQINRNSAKANVIEFDKIYKVDKYALAAIMGLTTADLPKNVKFPKISESNIESNELNVEFYLDMAIDRRPDLKQQKELVRAARYSLYSAWGAFSPTLDLNMNYGFTAGRANGAPDKWFGHNTNFNYGISTNWTVWQGGSRIFNIRNQEALYDIQQQNLLSNWISIVQDVRSRYTELMASIAQWKINKKTRELAKRRRDLVKEEYDAGNKDIATLNQAQNNYVVAEQNYVISTINVLNAKTKLRAAAGYKKEL